MQCFPCKTQKKPADRNLPPPVQKRSVVLELVQHCLYFFAEIRMEISKHLTEWVSAPSEMMSTPVSAMPRMVSAVTLPEASSSTLPSTRCTALVISSQLMLSSMMMSAPADRASSSSSLTCTSLCRDSLRIRCRHIAFLPVYTRKLSLHVGCRFS